jgi:SET domain-containing protein
MYLYKIEVRDSNIEGKGVFSLEKIEKNSIVWKFAEGHDQTLSIIEYNNLDEGQKSYLEKVAYLSPTSNQYVFPPENDPALYTNHDGFKNNLSVVIDLGISTEPFFVANRDIVPGEELTNNYHEFDEAIKSTKRSNPEWLK